MLYMIGTLALDTRPFAVDEMSREADASIAAKPLMGAAQAKEFTGEGEDDITLSGQLLPTKIGGLDQLEILHQMRKQGTPFPLMRGDGMRFGFWLAGSDAADCCRFAGGPYLAPEYLGTGLAIAARPDETKLTDAFDYALQQISIKGIFAELYLRYFPVSFY